jgi:hypothetical protein
MKFIAYLLDKCPASSLMLSVAGIVLGTATAVGISAMVGSRQTHSSEADTTGRNGSRDPIAVREPTGDGHSAAKLGDGKVIVHGSLCGIPGAKGNPVWYR